MCSAYPFIHLAFAEGMVLCAWQSWYAAHSPWSNVWVPESVLKNGNYHRKEKKGSGREVLHKNELGREERITLTCMATKVIAATSSLWPQRSLSKFVSRYVSSTQLLNTNFTWSPSAQCYNFHVAFKELNCNVEELVRIFSRSRLSHFELVPWGSARDYL